MVLPGISAIRKGRPPEAGSVVNDRELRSPGIGFITGFSLALTNPFTIAYWLLGAHILKSIGIVGRYDTTALIVLLAFRAAGISSSLVILSTGVYTVKRFFTDAGIRRITVIFGIATLAGSVYFFVKAVTTILSGSVPGVFAN